MEPFAGQEGASAVERNFGAAKLQWDYGRLDNHDDTSPTRGGHDAGGDGGTAAAEFGLPRALLQLPGLRQNARGRAEPQQGKPRLSASLSSKRSQNIVRALFVQNIVQSREN